MTPEDPYRIFLLVVAVLHHALLWPSLSRAKVIASIFQRREEGLLLTFLIGGPFVAYLLAGTTYLIRPRWMAWSQIGLRPQLRWCGAIILLVGSLLMIWSVRHLGRNLTISVSTKPQHQLVTSGPYGRIRHPLYAALLAGGIGLSLITANWFVALTAVLFWVPLAYRTGLEEKILLEKFGDSYRDYTQRTTRFLPRLPQKRGGSPFLRGDGENR